MISTASIRRWTITTNQPTDRTIMPNDPTPPAPFRMEKMPLDRLLEYVVNDGSDYNDGCNGYTKGTFDSDTGILTFTYEPALTDDGFDAYPTHAAMLADGWEIYASTSVQFKIIDGTHGGL